MSKKENEDINGFAIALVCFLYGGLMVLIGYLLNLQNKETNVAFWFIVLSIFFLVEVLKRIAVRIHQASARYVSIFLIEICTVSLCTILALGLVTLVIPMLGITKGFLVILVFSIILLLYIGVIKCGKKFNFHPKYREYKNEFEVTHNMVNLLTIPATFLTIYLLALGLDSKTADDIITENFLSMTIIYVLLIHYCMENRLNN